jgi:hypothetical protein
MSEPVVLPDNTENLDIVDAVIETVVNAVVDESNATATTTSTNEPSTDTVDVAVAVADDVDVAVIPTNDALVDIRTNSWSGTSQSHDEDDKEEEGISMDIIPPTVPPPITLVTQKDIPDPVNKETDWFSQMQYVIFHSELINLKKGNMIILKECAESKRLLDLKFADLTNNINSIQTSVIFLSTISGFFNATKAQFGIMDDIISVMSISISTYVTLVLSISKYYKYDEMRESIQILREKYSVLHNKIEHRSDVLGPWNDKNLWLFANAEQKLTDWSKVKDGMDADYVDLIETKKLLTTEFEVIMDTRSRNLYNIENKRLTYDNRKALAGWAIHELELESKIEGMFAKHDAKMTAQPSSMSAKRRESIQSGHEQLGDNWDDDEDDDV